MIKCGLFLVSLSLVFNLAVGAGNFSTYPTKVAIAFGDRPTEILVTWSTLQNCSSEVRYGTPTGQKYVATGNSTAFRTQFIHRVRLQKALPGAKHVYICGSDLGWSKQFSFTAMKSGNDWSARFAVFGDMGLTNAMSVPRLTYEVNMGLYDALLHVGDIAYNMQDNDGNVGDQYQQMIEPMAANVPYMMTVGNHDSYNNYSEYTNRFSTPGNQKGLFYSFDIGKAHIISVSTEFYYYYWDTTGFQQMADQYTWLIKDLQEAAKPQNRALRPWIIILGHRPMYCSNSDGDDCTWGFPRTRVGVSFLHWFGMEKLLWEYGVDLAIWAHEHSYERLWPIYNKKIYNGSLAEPYVNPKATVHLTTGSAGCSEGHNPFIKDLPYYTAFRSVDYGYSRMTVVNDTHLYWQQVADGQGGGVIDELWIVQDKHGSFQAK